MNIDSQARIVKKGTVEIISEGELLQKLSASKKKKKPLRIKYGADPSRPDLHLGHTVPLNKLRQFQELGHRVIFIIGDFTAMIGDPSGQSETRKPISPKEIAKNASTYQKQVFKILDKKRTELVYNSKWCRKMDFTEVIKLASRYTVARMLERDDFLKRYKAQRPIGIHEFLYPLIQGYDSVVVKADVEIGGTDQKFNLLVGRALQRDFGQTPQVAVILPLLVGTDGTQKMSKSLGNYIGITESPREMFGKIMSISDRLMFDYYSILLGNKKSELDTTDLKQLKLELARKLAARHYDPGVAEREYQHFEKVFSRRGLPDEMEKCRLEGLSSGGGKDVWIIKLLLATRTVSSRNEAERLVRQGAVALDGKKIREVRQNVTVKDGSVLKVGRRKFRKITSKISKKKT